MLRVPKRLPGVAIAWLALVAALLWLRDGKYSRFKHRNAEYHAAFAAACDSMLTQFSLATNKFFEFSAADPLVSRIVRDLHPAKIKVSTNWVWILVDGSHSGDGLVVVWEPQNERQTNMWNLVIGTGEGKTEAVYVAKH